jgi:outer membrane protein assembly factor BamE (lipoprotein component of BamABCDE complex)
MKNLNIILVLTFILSSCSSINSRGQYVDDKQVTTIAILKSTKVNIIENFGTPNIIPDYNKNVWYYVSRSMKDNNIKKPQTLSQRILIVKFNDNGLVIDFQVIETKDLPDITLSSEKTEIEGTNQGAIMQYIKNIGKFNTKAGKKRK